MRKREEEKEKGGRRRREEGEWRKVVREREREKERERYLGEIVKFPKLPRKPRN